MELSIMNPESCHDCMIVPYVMTEKESVRNADIVLSTGRTLRTVRMGNGSWFQFPLDAPDAEMTEAEYVESVEIALRRVRQIRESRNYHTGRQMQPGRFPAEF